MADANDGHKKADIFCKSVKARIGSLDAPKLHKDLLTFVSENLTTDSAFKALMGDQGKQAQALRKRRQAFLTIRAYVELVDDLNDNNPSCKADGVVDKCIKEFVFGAFKEILVLDTMYEQARIKADAINPNGYYRAFGATADQIHMSTGGLSGFLAHGEPTLVSYVVAAMEAMENGSPAQALTQASTVGLAQGVGSAHSSVPVIPDLKRGREGEGMIQQTTPPYGWVCAFCLKPNHSALVCRLRIKEEKKRNSLQQPQQHPAARPTVFGQTPLGNAGAMAISTEEQERFVAFKKYCEWAKSQPH